MPMTMNFILRPNGIKLKSTRKSHVTVEETDNLPIKTSKWKNSMNRVGKCVEIYPKILERGEILRSVGNKKYKSDDNMQIMLKLHLVNNSLQLFL